MRISASKKHSIKVSKIRVDNSLDFDYNDFNPKWRLNQ